MQFCLLHCVDCLELVSFFPLTDKDDFVVNSGWFTFPGMSKGKSALQHFLARKANMKYEQFMAVRKAVYRLKYREEKVSVF